MAQDKRQVDAITARDVDFAQWYTDVCKKAELIDYTSVKGMFIYRPYGYALWENPGVPAPEGEGPCGGLCTRMCVGHCGRQ